MEKLPLYRIVVNPDDDTTGVYAVSLVDEPAIEVDWIKLSKQIIDEFHFAADGDKQMLFGPLLIPDKKILRRDDDGFEYNIYFDAETIQVIADKYNENKLGDIFNFQHSDKKVDAVLLQNWITGEKDKSQDWGFELPKGSWFGGVKVKDKEFWMSEIKTEKVKGFSIEIKAGTELIKMTTEVDKNKTNLMEVKTKAGLTLTWDGDAAVGKEVFIILEDGTQAPVADGEYELEDGTKIVTSGGKVAEIMAPETQSEDMQDTTVAPSTDVLEEVRPMIEELRSIIAELTTRIDKLENVETVVEEANNDENYAKIAELEEKVEKLSKLAGAESITKKNDREVDFAKREEALLSKIMAFKKSTKN